MKDQVAAWLATLEGTTDASPITMTIGDETWEGAIYKQHDDWRYYLVGKRPKSHVRRPRTCYQFEGSDRDWYVATYLVDYDNLTEAQKGYHPFGKSWCLFCWNAPGKIDDYETEYRRIPVVAT